MLALAPLALALLVFLTTGTQPGEARNIACTYPRKTIFFATNSIFFKRNCTIWTTTLNASGQSGFFPVTIAKTFGTPDHEANGNGRVDYIVSSISEGPTYNFVRGLWFVVWNDSWINPMRPGGMIFAARIDKSQMITMTQSADWEKPVASVQFNRISTYEFNLTTYANGQNKTYHIGMQQTASLTGATPSATIYFQETFVLGPMHAYHLKYDWMLAGNWLVCPYNDFPPPIAWHPFEDALESITWRGPWPGPMYNMHINQYIRPGSLTPKVSPAPRSISVGLCEGDVQTWKTCCNAIFPASPSTSRSPTASRSVSVTPTTAEPGGSETSTPSPSPSEAETPSFTPSATSSEEATSSTSVSPSVSSSVAETPSLSPSPASGSVTASVSPSPVYSAEPTPSLTPSSSGSPSVEASVTASGSESPSLSATTSLSASGTPSNMPTRSETASTTSSPSFTRSTTPSPSFTRSQTPSPTGSRSNSPSPSRSRSVTASRSVLPTKTPSPSVSPSISRSPSVTPSESGRPNVQVEIAVAGPDFTSDYIPKEKILLLMLALKCDLSDICGVRPKDINCVDLASVFNDNYLFDAPGKITAEDVRYVESRNDCYSIRLEIGIIDGNGDPLWSNDDDPNNPNNYRNRGRLPSRMLSGSAQALAGDNGLATEQGDDEDSFGSHPMDRVVIASLRETQRTYAAARAAQALPNNGVVTNTKPLFNVTFIITPSSGSRARRETPMNQNVLERLKPIIQQALAQAKGQQAGVIFPASSTLWTQANNVTTWNQNSLFNANKVQPVAVVPGEAAPVGPPPSNSTQDKLPIILGTTLGLCCGMALVALLIALIVARRRRRVREQSVEQAYQDAQANKYNKTIGVVALGSINGEQSPRLAYPPQPLPAAGVAQ